MRIGVSVLIALLVGLGLASSAQATEAPIAAYSFDEGEGTTLHDDSGSHDGTIENGAEWVGGKFGMGLRFDAEDDCVTIPDASDLDLGATFTLEAWVRPQQNRVWTPVISKDASGEWFSYELLDHGETGTPMGLTGQGTATYAETVGEDPPSPLLWSHLALTSDGEDLSLYLNGEVLDTASALTPQASTKPLRLGCSETWGHFEGVIDEVRIYDRALDAEELATDRKTAIATPPSEDPIAAYSFDEGEGEIAHDAFGEHDGVVEGAQWVGGKFGGALHFDNENEEKVRIASADDLRLSGDFTIEAWVRPQHAAYWFPVITKEAGTQFGYQLYAGGEGPGFAEGYVAQRDWVYSGVAGPEATSPRIWTHLALTCDGSHLRLYEDGVLVDTGDPCSAQGGEGDLLIGGNDVFGERFEGTIDEVRVYNRALGAEEIGEDCETAIETPPSQYPIAAYSFGEGEGGIVQDAFRGHDGTVEGAEWVEGGKFGGALRFDREAEDIVSIPDAKDLRLSGSFTLEAWVKPEENEYWMPVVNKETEGFVSYQLYAGGETPGLAEGYVANRDWDFSIAAAPEALPVNAWTHLALVCDGEHLSLYEDGELVDTAPACSSQQSEGDLLIGGNEVFGEYFDGLIDEVRVYDRALSALEIEEDGESEAVSLLSVFPPSIDGNPEETIELSVGPGGWAGRTPITFKYQWERCGEEGCTNIPDATSTTYLPIAEDVGSRLRVEVKATNALESRSAFSDKTSLVTKSPPRFEAPVTITGTRTVGNVLSVDVSGLQGSEPMVLTYEWERCVEYCLDLEEEDGAYELLTADAASQLRVRVTAENEAGEATQRTVTTGYITPSETEGKPRLAKPPMLRGLRKVGSELSSTTGDWVGAGSIETSIQWERCGKEACEDIAGATEFEYELEPSDQGMQIKSRVTATNSLGETKGFSARTPRALPAVTSVFTMKSGTSLEDVLEGLESAEAKLVSFDYSGETRGIYLNHGVETSEILSDFSTKVEDEDAAGRPVLSFTVWDDVSTEAFGALGTQVEARGEAPTLRVDAPAPEGPALRNTTNFTGEMVKWASLGAWSPAEQGGGDDRALEGMFQWHPTEKEVLEYYESTSSPMAFEFDVKEINRSNEDVLPEVKEIDPGICLPWEKNDFWIGTREFSHFENNFPEEAGFYWDTGISDSCQVKDLTFGLFHPDKLEPLKVYEAIIYFDGGGAWEGPPLPWEGLFGGVWPALDNESAVGDADSSPFQWGLQMLGMHCDFSATACVGITEIDVGGEGKPLIEENQEFWEDPTFEDYGPALLPGCFRFNNPVFPLGKDQKPGVLPCQDVS
jgi:hypothetical protein